MTEIALPPPPRAVRHTGGALFLRCLLWLLAIAISAALTWLLATNSRQWGWVQQSDLGRNGKVTHGTVTGRDHQGARVKYSFDVGMRPFAGESALPDGAHLPREGDLVTVHYRSADPAQSAMVPHNAPSPGASHSWTLGKIARAEPETWRLHYEFQVAGQRHVGFDWSMVSAEGNWPSVGAPIRVLYDTRDPDHNKSEISLPHMELGLRAAGLVWVLPISAALLAAALAFETFLRRARNFFAIAKQVPAEVVANEGARDYWFQWVTLITAVFTLGLMPYLHYHKVIYRVHCGGRTVERAANVPVNAAEQWSVGQILPALVSEDPARHRLLCQLSSWVRSRPAR